MMSKCFGWPIAPLILAIILAVQVYGAPSGAPTETSEIVESQHAPVNYKGKSVKTQQSAKYDAYQTYSGVHEKMKEFQTPNGPKVLSLNKAYKYGDHSKPPSRSASKVVAKKEGVSVLRCFGKGCDKQE